MDALGAGVCSIGHAIKLFNSKTSFNFQKNTAGTFSTQCDHDISSAPTYIPTPRAMHPDREVSISFSCISDR